MARFTQRSTVRNQRREFAIEDYNRLFSKIFISTEASPIPRSKHDATAPSESVHMIAISPECYKLSWFFGMHHLINKSSFARVVLIMHRHCVSVRDFPSLLLHLGFVVLPIPLPQHCWCASPPPPSPSSPSSCFSLSSLPR